MNSFDAVVYLGLAIAMITGFNTGLVRSAVTILAYVIAAPIAMAAMTFFSSPAGGKLVPALLQNGLMFFGIFLFAGIALGKLARLAIDEATGSEAGIMDRLCGAAARRGARRPDRGDDRPRRRPVHAAATSAVLADRFAAAAVALGGRAKGRQIASAGCRRHPRSPEAKPADIIALLICVSDSAQPLIRAARLGYSAPVGLQKIT